MKMSLFKRGVGGKAQCQKFHSLIYLTKMRKGDNFENFSYFWGKFRPNSDQILGKDQNSDQTRKIRPDCAHCKRYHQFCILDLYIRRHRFSLFALYLSSFSALCPISFFTLFLFSLFSLHS